MVGKQELRIWPDISVPNFPNRSRQFSEDAVGATLAGQVLRSKRSQTAQATVISTRAYFGQAPSLYIYVAVSQKPCSRKQSPVELTL